MRDGNNWSFGDCKLEFRIWDKPVDVIYKGKVVRMQFVHMTSPESFPVAGFLEHEKFGFALSGDYCCFLNDKYVDKNINEMWNYMDREARIKYHREQLALLLSDDPVCYLSEGNGVQR